MNQRRAAERLSTVRISGSKGRVSMVEADYHALNNRIPSGAHCRLMAAFDMFCAGNLEIVSSVFRSWADGNRSLAEFKAHGVTILGRLAPQQGVTIFYITQISWPAETSDAGTPPPSQPSQAELPLHIHPAHKGPWND